MKIIITEEEKNNILSLYNINEQLKSLDDIFKGVRKSKFLDLDDSRNLIKISKNIAYDVHFVADNSKNIDEFGAKLISFFRQDMDEEKAILATNNLLKSVAETTGHKTARDYYNSIKGVKPTNNIKKTFKSVNEMSKNELEKLLNKLPNDRNVDGWRYFGRKTTSMSGWKFHVYGEDLYDSVFLYEKLLSVANKWGADAKVSGENIQVFTNLKSPQWGKQGASIYIPPEVISKGQVNDMLLDIQSAITQYSKKGNISGDQMITNNIGYRYDFNQPINYKKGVDTYSEGGGYRANEGGDYKPSGVIDLFKIK